MTIDIHFGKKIKQIIEKSGDTYIQAAERLGSTASTVNRWTRQADLDTGVLKQVCNGYKITMSYFLSDSASYTQNNQVANGGINAVGEKIIQYQQQSNSAGQTNEQTIDQKVLLERLKGCEEKVILLQKMVSILEKN